MIGDFSNQNADQKSIFKLFEFDIFLLEKAKIRYEQV